MNLEVESSLEPSGFPGGLFLTTLLYYPANSPGFSVICSQSNMYFSVLICIISFCYIVYFRTALISILLTPVWHLSQSSLAFNIC